MGRPAWLERGIREHFERLTTPPPLLCEMTVEFVPPETLDVRVRADHLRRLRSLFAGMTDDEIVADLIAATLDRLGALPPREK